MNMHFKLHFSICFQKTQPAVLSNTSLFQQVQKSDPKWKSMLAYIPRVKDWVVPFLHLLNFVHHLRPCLRSYLDQKLSLTVQPWASPFWIPSLYPWITGLCPHLRLIPRTIPERSVPTFPSSWEILEDGGSMGPMCSCSNQSRAGHKAGTQKMFLLWIMTAFFNPFWLLFFTHHVL